MATHEVPDLHRKPLHLYYNTPELAATAATTAELLTLFPELTVWKVQYKAPNYRDNAWYVGLVEQAEPTLFNIKITPADLNVEFRFTHYLPKDIIDRLKWQNTSWVYARYKQHGRAAVADMMRTYLTALMPDYRLGKLKSGGKSSAETLLCRHLERLFPGHPILPNKRLDDLRSAKGKPLELDLWMPSLNLAVEVQGPQHFEAVWGDNSALLANDQHKRRWCKAQGIKLAWMNWDGVVKGLLRLPDAEQHRHLKEVFGTFVAGDRSFLWWRAVGVYESE